MSVKTFKQINPAVGANWVYVYDLQADQYGEVVISVVEARPVAKAVETITVRAPRAPGTLRADLTADYKERGHCTARAQRP